MAIRPRWGGSRERVATAGKRLCVACSGGDGGGRIASGIVHTLSRLYPMYNIGVVTTQVNKEDSCWYCSSVILEMPLSASARLECVDRQRPPRFSIVSSWGRPRASRATARGWTFASSRPKRAIPDSSGAWVTLSDNRTKSWKCKRYLPLSPTTLSNLIDTSSHAPPQRHSSEDASDVRRVLHTSVSKEEAQ